MAAKKVDMACPDLVKRYNRGMGGVDLMDSSMANYCVLAQEEVVVAHLQLVTECPSSQRLEAEAEVHQEQGSLPQVPQGTSGGLAGRE